MRMWFYPPAGTYENGFWMIELPGWHSLGNPDPWTEFEIVSPELPVPVVSQS